MANWLSTTKDGVAETRTFDVTNALLTQQVDNQTTNLNYDLDGNLKNDNKFHYAFDAFQRIVEVKDQSQNLVAKCQMDTSNRRISKTVGTTVHRTVYASWQVAEEHETVPSGKKFKTTTKVYVYGQYIDEPLVMKITKPNGNQKKCGVEEDHPVTSVPPLPRWELLNTYALTNDNGKIVETYHYSAYANTYFYTGRLLDSETNLYYFRNRYYNANQGRFISRDPIGYVDGMSLYRGYFAVNGLDWSGLDFVPTGGFWNWNFNRDDYFVRELHHKIMHRLVYLLTDILQEKAMVPADECYENYREVLTKVGDQLSAVYSYMNTHQITVYRDVGLRDVVARANPIMGSITLNTNPHSGSNFFQLPADLNSVSGTSTMTSEDAIFHEVTHLAVGSWDATPNWNPFTWPNLGPYILDPSPLNESYTLQRIYREGLEENAFKQSRQDAEKCVRCRTAAEEMQAIVGERLEH